MCERTLTTEDTADHRGELFSKDPVIPCVPLWLMVLFQDLHRVQRAFRRFLMLEICEHVAFLAKMFAHSIHHGPAFVGRVTGFAVAVVAEVSGYDVRGDSLFGFGDAER